MSQKDEKSKKFVYFASRRFIDGGAGWFFLLTGGVFLREIHGGGGFLLRATLYMYTIIAFAKNTKFLFLPDVKY